MQKYQIIVMELRSRLVLHFAECNNIHFTLEQNECVHELYMSQCNVIP